MEVASQRHQVIPRSAKAVQQHDDRTIAAAVADAMRLTFVDVVVGPGSATEGRPVTASFGVSAVNLGAEDAPAMVDQADQALYESKTSGRNRVTVWSAGDLPSDAAA